MIYIKHSVLGIFLLLSSLLFAQTEAEMKVQADKFFDNEQYLEATPLYLRLLALQPKDVQYNYKYGTCLLFNSNYKSGAIKYLNYAVNNDPDIVPEAYYFLGKALHFNYQFNDAIKYYSQYNEKKAKATKQFDADREIQMCQNGKRLMTTISDIIVTEKKEISKDKFFRIYDLQDIGGSMLVTAEFQSKLDKKNNHIPLIHFPQKPSVIYYSSYGDDGKTGKDIYVRRRLPDGSWGIPQKIPGNVNTEFDEDFPYMHPDGNYLYFSSKGHNSMGGYDVFRSKYDPDNNSFGPPENMDFAISSPDDDMFYIVDSLNKNAYFASARQSQNGMLYVYKVKVDRVPLQLAVVKGRFNSEIDPNIKRIDFEIRDFATGELIGKFNSNEKAVYLITFPKGGKYEYIMRIEGSPRDFRTVVSIPFQKEFRPLKQKIVHLEENGAEVVKVIDLFNEEVEDPQAVIAEVIRKRSDLEVNVTEFNLEELEKDKKNKEILNDLGMGDLLLVEVANKLKDEVKNIEESRKEADQLRNNVNALVVQNSADFVKLEEQIKTKVAEANKAQTDDNKYTLMKEAEKLINRQYELKADSKHILQMSDSIDRVVKSSVASVNVAKLKDLAESFDKLYRDGKEKEALDLLASNKELVRDILNDRSLELRQNLVVRSIKLDDQLRDLNKRIDAYDRDIKELETQIQSLENSRYSAKKKDLPEIEAKIEEKKQEIELIRGEKKKLEERVDLLDQEKFMINQQIYMLDDIQNQRSSSAVSRDVAERSLMETEKTNTNTLNSYVQQQINDLEKKDPTLKDRIVVSSGMRAENIIAEHRTQQRRIQTNNSLNKEQKNQKLLENAQKTKNELEARLKDVEDQLKNNKFDERLNSEKQQILKALQQVNAEIKALQKELGQEELIASNAPDREEIEQNIFPDYERRIEEIMGDRSLSKDEKAEKQRELDEQYLAQVDEQIRTNNDQLKSAPNDADLKKKAEVLNEIRSEKVNEMRDKELAQMQPGLNDDLLKEALYPGFDKKIASIENDASKNQLEKLNALQKEKQSLLTKVNDRQRVVETAIQRDQSNQSLIKENALLTQLKQDLTSSIDKHRSEISALNRGEEIQLTAAELINKVDPDFSDRKKQIESDQSLNELEKLKELQRNNAVLLDKLSERIISVDAELKKDPTNKNLQDEKQLIEKLVSDLNAEQGELSAKIRMLEGSSVAANPAERSKDELISDLYPEYLSNKKKIDDNSGLNDIDRLKQLNENDEQLLSAVRDRIESLESETQTSEVRKELEDLRSLEKEVSDRIAEQEDDIARASTSPVKDLNTLINSVDPKYASDIKSIENNIKLNDEEKLRKVQLRDKELQSALNEAISENEAKLKKDPSNGELKVRNEQLTEAIAVVESRIEERSQIIDSQSTAELTAEESQKRKEQLFNKLDSKYTSNKSGLDPEKDNIELIEIEKKMLSKLEAERRSIEKTLSKDPFNKDAIVQMKIVESAIKDVQSSIAALEEAKDGYREITFTPDEKSEFLKEVLPEYSDVKEELSNDNGNENSLKEELQLENQLSQELNERIQANQKILDNEPNNRVLKKESALLKQLISENEAEIKEIQKKIHGMDVQEYQFTPEELNATRNEISPEYASRIKEISNDPVLSAEQKAEESIVADRLLLNELLDREEVIVAERIEDPTNEQLIREQKLLESLTEQTEKQIENKEKQLDQIKSSVSLEMAVQGEYVDRIDPSYKEDVRFILENENLEPLRRLELLQAEDLSLIEKVNKRVEELEAVKEPLPIEVLNELSSLKAISSQLLERTSERQAEIERLKNGGTPISERQAIVRDELLSDYAGQRQAIQANSDLSEERKTLELVKLEEALQQKAEDKINDLSADLEKDPENSDLRYEKEQVEKIIMESSEEVERLKGQRTTVSKEQVITEVMSDYADRKTELLNSKMEEGLKTEQLIKLEKDLLTKLSSEERAIRKQLDKDPANKELEARLKAVQELISVQKESIAQLEQRKAELASTDQAHKQITAVDKNYEKDIATLNAQPDSPEKFNALAEREKEHRDKLETQILNNQKSLDRKDDSALKAVNEVIRAEAEASVMRENSYRMSAQENSDPGIQEKENYLSTLRDQLLGETAAELIKEYSTLEELKAQDQLLSNYENSIKESISDVESKRSNDPNNEDLNNELSWLKEELASVQAKRRKVSLSVGELEQQVVAAGNPDRRVDSPELRRLEQEEKELSARLNDPSLTSAERKQTERALDNNRKEQINTENTVLSEKLEANETSASNAMSDLNKEKQQIASNEYNIALSKAQNALTETKKLRTEAEKARSAEEKNYLLNKAAVSTDRTNEEIENARYVGELELVKKEYGLTSLETRGELEAKKRRFSIEVGELTTEMIGLDKEIAEASKKEKPALIAERSAKEEERRKLQAAIEAIDNQLNNMPGTTATLNPEAISTPVSREEEKQIAMSDEYRAYAIKANYAMAAEKELITLEQQLGEARSELKQSALVQAKDPSVENRQTLENNAQKVKELEDKIADQRSVLAVRQKEANALLPKDNTEAMKMQNLVSRAIEPVSKAVVAAALLQIPVSGLEICTPAEGVYTANNPIPVDVNTPSGLVYRVQVGAFAKPIPQELFREFNPVSGEKLNSGITRYMAGYFNSETKVMEARNEIRGLGYADAFPVAYCDGKRISIAEARQLEASGACIPKGENQLMMEVAMNTVQKVDPQLTGNYTAQIDPLELISAEEDTSRRRKPQIDLSYNKAPGAAEAEAIELKKGLFFTVQIGVYNKPVSSATLFNLEPYMSLRLPNGQIRYSTGIFHSIDEARPRKQEAINAGVRDAFITAYFNGERITLADAAKMLSERGNGILEPKEGQAAIVVKETEQVKTVMDPEVVRNPDLVTKPKEYLQIVTKKQFSEFPSDVLNRYNSHGSFYFDAADGRVKSAISDSDEDLPQVHYFRNDIDTVRFKESNEFTKGTIVCLTFAEGALPGDLIDWILRQNYRKEYYQREEGVTMFVHGVPEDKIDQFLDDVRSFGFEGAKVAPETNIRDYKKEE